MNRFDALLWDVDGVLAETERDGHRVAFNRAFEACGLPWRWDEARYGELLRTTGGRERLLSDMATRADAPTLASEREALARAVHVRKNAYYAEQAGAGGIALRDGVLALMQECLGRGVRMGIASTTSRANVDALLRHHLGAAWREWFATVVCGEDVRFKKPDPEVYVRALRELGDGPLQVVAIEDSPGGVAAAREVEVPVLVTRSACFETATIEDAIAIGPGLHDRRGWRPALPWDGRSPLRVGLDDIEAWYERMETVSQFA
jgi:beta-phosphoglucomutase-like phosphatase (HAD superfamily)